MPRCNNCKRNEAQGASFAHKAKDGKLDTLCIKCRFNEIDGRAASQRGIREDMRRADIPVVPMAKKLKYE